MTDIDPKAAYVRDVTERTRAYLRELHQENERLRGLLASSEADRAHLTAELLELRQAREMQKSAGGGLDGEALQRLEEENSACTARYLALEQKNLHLANLYVASYRLHETLSRDEVLGIVQEIIINLVGCEQHSIYEISADGIALVLVAGMGIDVAKVGHIGLADDPVARSLRSGKVFVASGAPAEALGHPYPVTACVPLRLAGKTMGAIVLYQLLPHKPGIEDIDRELFELLAVHAGMALYATKLHQAATAS